MQDLSRTDKFLMRIKEGYGCEEICGVNGNRRLCPEMRRAASLSEDRSYGCERREESYGCERKVTGVNEERRVTDVNENLQV